MALTGGMEGLTTGVTNMLTFVSTMLDTILSNPVLAMFFAAGVIGIAIGIVGMLKHA